MDAKVTITLSPQEFDLVRDALNFQVGALREMRKTGQPGEKTKWRETEARLALLLEKVQ